MNKRIVLLLITAVFIIATIPLAVFADDTRHDMDEEIADIIDSRLTEAERVLLSDGSKYSDSLKDVTLDGLPILKVYQLHWEYSDKPLDELVAAVDKSDGKLKASFYVVFDEDPYKICVLKKDDGSVLIGKTGALSDTTPTFFTDIKNLSGEMVFEGESCKIENIYCFDSTTSFFGASVYIKTDKGVFVKYYEYEQSQGVVFTETEFRKAAAEYSAFISSYEYNYDENGEGLNGTLSFAEFLNSGVHGQKPETGSSLTPVYIVLIVCAAALALFYAVFKIINRS